MQLADRQSLPSAARTPGHHLQRVPIAVVAGQSDKEKGVGDAAAGDR